MRINEILLIPGTGDAGAGKQVYRPGIAATLAATVDVAAVEEHLVRYAVSCPLCRAVGQMGVAQRTCDLAAHGSDDGLEVVLVVCRRCGYLMPLAADRIRPSDPPTE